MKNIRMLFDKPIKEEKDFYTEARQHYCERMRSQGYDIRIPEEDELLIDIDDEEAMEKFNEAMIRLMDECVESQLDYPTWTIFPSKNGKHNKYHKHIVVKMPKPLNEFERIALQALLGSDPMRELLSIFRIWNDDLYPTLLAMVPKDELKPKHTDMKAKHHKEYVYA